MCEVQALTSPLIQRRFCVLNACALLSTSGGIS